MRFHFYHPQDGHPNFDHCLEEAQDLASAIGPVIKKDAELTGSDKIRDGLRKINSLKKLVENYRVNQARYRRGDHGLRPLYVIWTMLNACNFRCTYCDNHQGDHYFDLPDPNRLNTDRGKRLLEVMSTGTKALYWCGGEPTLRDDLPELLDYAWQLGYFPNMINTNGSLLHQRLKRPSWRNFLWQMDTIIVSLDGLNLERVETLWGTQQGHRVVTNLLLLRELQKVTRFKLAVNTVVTPDSIDDARAVLDFVGDLGLWFVPVPVNFKHGPNRELLENPSYIELAEQILERKQKGHRIIGSRKLLKQLLFAEPYRCHTALKPHVWSDGSLCWPCRASSNVPPVNIKLLDYHSFDDAYEAGRKQVNPNFFHGPARNQCGGQCAWMQNYTTARYMEGLIDPLRSGILQEILEFAFQRRPYEN